VVSQPRSDQVIRVDSSKKSILMNNQIIDSFFKDNKRKVICEDEFITDNMIIYIEEKK